MRCKNLDKYHYHFRNIVTMKPSVI